MRNRKIMLAAAAAFIVLAASSYFGFAFTSNQTIQNQKAALAGDMQKAGKTNNAVSGNSSSLNNADSTEKTEKARESAVKVKSETVKPTAVKTAGTQPQKTAVVASRGAKSSDIVLQRGAVGSKVTGLQKKLKILGFLSVAPTGYYGDLTVAAVKKLQKKYRLTQDGIVHKSTISLIDRLVKEKNAKAAQQRTASIKSKTTATVSSSTSGVNKYLLPWYTNVNNTFQRDETATVYDIQTGMSFKIKRTYGYNHADCETLTSADTKIMKQIYGGQWSWVRRPVIVIEDGRRIAASMAGMPHAGVDSKPANANVSWRSGDYGAGANLDAVKNNNMDGHFDIHFLGSRTHGTNRVDEGHQSAVKKAAAWAEKNY